MTTVLHRHCRELGYCNRGLREWFEREGLDWPAFVREGIAADVLRIRDNDMVARAIERAERDEHGKQ